MEILGAFPIGEYIPSLAWVTKVRGFDRKVDKLKNEIDSFLEKVVQEHVDADEDQLNFVDILLSTQRDKTTPFELDKTSLKTLLLIMGRGGGRKESYRIYCSALKVRFPLRFLTFDLFCFLLQLHRLSAALSVIMGRGGGRKESYRIYCSALKVSVLQEVINRASDRGITPLHVAALKGDIETVQLLLDWELLLLRFICILWRFKEAHNKTVTDGKLGGHKRRVNTRWKNKSDKDKERRQFLPVICVIRII
ncbi:hypothetical protein DY000_02009625 [Brassica cretica]|uniref:Uncharacterized protein n=1 Tax=Brassica cretica TaxID=69181 RepID=A0ABQ7CBY2_BRACR|nr:hypothetical protein DY000_02009625 [Brassica cretica]